MNTTPTLGWSKRKGSGFECVMSWLGVVAVVGRGETRLEASGRAAALYRAAIWLRVLKEGRA